jgi:molecular chaperone GrpE (heat shock protein)
MAGTEFEEDDPQQEQSQQQSDFKTQQKLQALKDQLTKANEHLLRIFRKASTYR